MHTLVVNSTFCHWLLVVLPWSLYVIKAKHEVNLISIFNITRLNNRYILQGLSSLSFWPRTPQSDQTAVLCLSWKIFYQQHLIKVVWYCLYVGTHWELATKKPLCVCVCLSPLSVCLSVCPVSHIERHEHTHVCVCALTQLWILHMGSTEVKIWYITQWLIDFSTTGELPGLSERQSKGERERIREQHSVFHKVWLTNWIHWLPCCDCRPLRPAVTLRK